jgi:hypothetical protein
LTGKAHLAADRRCRPLAFVLARARTRIRAVIPEKTDQAANRKGGTA